MTYWDREFGDDLKRAGEQVKREELTKGRCLYPVRVPQDVPWDLAFPGERACGEPATHSLEMAFYLDGYNEPGVTHHRTRLFTMGLCDRHAGYAPSVRLVGPNAADYVPVLPSEKSPVGEPPGEPR